jgi:anaerobic magnesium-protoporphyrin IX monomethyl ester cyclase
MSNVERARRWFRQNGPELGEPLELAARHDFQLFERTLQPTLPGPLPPDFAEWGAAIAPRRSEIQDGSVRARRLPVV